MLGRRFRGGKDDGEQAAFARLALDGEASAHCGDQAFGLERAYAELGFKPPKVVYEVSFQAAPLEKCDYMLWNRMYNAWLASAPNETRIRELSKSFTFGQQIRVRNHGLGKERTTVSFTPRPRASERDAEGGVTTYSFADLPSKYGLPQVAVALTVTAEAFTVTVSTPRNFLPLP